MERALVLLVAVLAFAPSVSLNVCQSMDIRNLPSELERLRNCTIIMGDLWLVLMEHVHDPSVFQELTFPELLEIEDYLVVYSVRNLTSLGTIFPNLRVIRGTNLYLDYSLVLYHVDELKEIGLTKLRHIGRGKVRVEKCPNLCYVETIDWQRLGAKALDLIRNGTDVCTNQYCRTECAGHCWNGRTCQTTPVEAYCHELCIGCTQRDSPDHCLACKFYKYNNSCVRSCPESTITHNYSMMCMSPAECFNLPNSTWFVNNGTCIKECPPKYQRDEKLGCVYVGRNWTKVCEGLWKVNNLEVLENMTLCTHIRGSLELSISKDPHELEVHLGNIVSISGYLRIGRINTITSLEFLNSLEEIKGEQLYNKLYALFVFENQNLRTLWNITHNFSIGNGTIGFHENPMLCRTEIEKLANATDSNNTLEHGNGYKGSCLANDILKVSVENQNSTNVTLVWQTPSSIEDIIGYTVYYVKATINDVYELEDTDGCKPSAWIGAFVRESRIDLKDLTPYTRYAYYIKIYSTSKFTHQTNIKFFNTTSGDPSAPVDVAVEATSDTSILLIWRPPFYLNGNFSHYVIAVYTENDYLPTIEERNYCYYPYIEDNEKEQPVTTISKPSSCQCEEDDDTDFSSAYLIDHVCVKSDKYCKSHMYHMVDDNSTYKLNIQKRAMSNNNATHIIEVHTEGGAGPTKFYEFDDLKHYTVYVFYIRACNVDNFTEVCGFPEMTSQRTKKRSTADIIPDLRVEFEGRRAIVSWSAPREVNSVLLSYEIEYNKTDVDHAKSTSECITPKQFLNNGKKFKTTVLDPGRHSVRVRAVSLAGPGKFTRWFEFTIDSEGKELKWLYGVLSAVAFVLLVLLGFLIRYRYRKKYALDSNHLITSINPDYAGPIYEEDEWELDRNDIEFVKDLGQGTFGMVYEGIIKSKRYPCAIKTVNESATMPSRMEFLNEGSVMKSFNDGHHVVRLLGIVSRGQPPLVIMELMERGDLKSYLRRCREPSQNLTTNELYRMAAEIADGMAYLSAKKFVHRDVAARNCMVAADRTVKIGDFGMARDVYETDYYRKETVGLLPVRWMAPESLADGVFTSDSDVWSYGVVLWEMATLAEQPYQGLSNEEVFRFVKNRGKLDRPPECSDLMFEVMEACWMWRPNDRPTFADIVAKLADHVGEDFRLVAFCYSKQGQELALNAGPRVYNPPAMTAAPEDDFFSHYDPVEEEVSLYVKDSNRPTKFLPFSSSNQRYNKSSPYQISHGSPASSFSFTSS